MKKAILCSILAVATMFAGCQKDLTDVNSSASGIQPGPLVKVKVVLDDTRLSIDGAGELAWSEGDEIAVILKGSDGSYARDTENTYTINHEDNTVLIPENAAYALYPASLDFAIEGTSLAITLPHKYTLDSPEDILALNPMKAYVENGFLAFRNLVGFVKVPLTGNGVVRSVTLKTICRTTSDFHPIAAKCSIDIEAEIAGNGGIKMAEDNSAYSFLQCSFKRGLELANSPTIIFPVPAGEYSNMALVIEGEDDSYAIYGTGTHTINRSSFRTLSNTAINPVERTAGEAISVIGEGENNFDKYASCYLVPPTAGRYSFPAILADGTELAGGAVAEIKWAEKAGLVSNIHYNIESNTISFSTNGEEGNALITLHDNSLTGPGTVWNWHIWVSDTPKVLSIKGMMAWANTTLYLMDRVVGATWAPSTAIESNIAEGSYSLSDKVALADANDGCGLYFQCQNGIPYPRIKDLHFVGKEDISTLENTRCEVMYGLSQYGQYWSTSAACGNVGQDIHNNGQYMHQSMYYPNYEYEKIGTGTKHDNTSGTVSMWTLSNLVSKPISNDSSVVVDDSYRFWNSPNNNTYDVLSKSKTNHDPCPPGYILENYSMNYWYYQTRKKSIKFVRAADDNANYAAGYKFYGAYLEGFTDEEGNSLPLYSPCGGNRTTGVTNLSGNYGNMGFIYFVQTNNTYQFTLEGTKVACGANIQYGASTNGKTIGVPGANATKIVNAQGYHVRCRKP